MDVVRITFIFPPGCSDESEVSDIMLQSFKLCKSNVAQVSWLEESKIPDTDFTKTDYVIFQVFKGKHFEKLQESKCARILGPWCVSICLMEGKAIPNFPWPIYNVAMMNCIVSCSYMSKDKKLAIKEKVHLMGGAYKEDFLTTSTHLITDTVKSEKYMAAAEAGVRLMLPAWVDAIWEASQDKNVHANDDTFKKHRCLPFHKLTISSTGIPNKTKREELSRIIINNGGTFTASLALSKTDVLVCHGDACTSSQKFKAAKNAGSIECVTPEWVTDSIAKGYALPYTSYVVKRFTSTPTKEDMTGPNFSMMSAIVPSNAIQRSTVNETVAASMTMNMSYRSTPVKRKSSDMDSYNAILDELDIKRVKRAGQCLDGCSLFFLVRPVYAAGMVGADGYPFESEEYDARNISTKWHLLIKKCKVYLTGFDGESKDKINKYLVLSGATKYDSISDRLTHIIVGDPSCPEVKFIKSKSYPVSLVSVRWLVDSISNCKVLDEEAYLVNLLDPEKDPCSSPLSQKGISLLKNKVIAENVLEEADATKTVAGSAENSIMKQYQMPESETDTLAQLLREKNNDFNYPTQSEYRAETLTLQLTENDESSQVQLFRGLTFLLVDCDEDIRSTIEDAAGTVVSSSYPCQPDFEVYQVVVKCEIPNVPKGKTVVNMIWIFESIQEGELQSLKYYHRPCVVKDTLPLQDCVVTMSSYTSYERTFLKHLIEAIGGVHQEQFSRITNVQKNVQGSTHLVSLEASGKKYLAALKWKLPVVDKDWLLECAKSGELVPEADFLVGKCEGTFKVRTPATASTTTMDRTSDALLIKNDKGVSIKPNESVSKVNESRSTANESLHKVSSTSISKINASNFETSATAAHSTPAPANVQDHNATQNDINNTTPIMFKNPMTTLGLPEEPEFFTPVQHTKGPQDIDKINCRSPCSQVTPVNKIMQEVRRNNLLCNTRNAGTPETPPFRKPWMNMPTPKTPVGAFVRPNPSPQFRKEMAAYLNTFPDFKQPNNRRNSTPISELKRRIWSSLESQDTPANDENEPSTSFKTIEKNVENIEKNDDLLETHGKVPSQNTIVNANLKQLEDMLRDSDKSRRTVGNFQSPITMQDKAATKESEPLTVGWDYAEQDSNNQLEPKKRVFMISGVADSQVRQSMVSDLKSLGGEVLEAQSYDSACTHLILVKPQRNEKTLACMAAGTWILHTSYIEKSVQAGDFLNEEEFEFGNPKAKMNINMSFDKDTKQRADSMYWWRKVISKRGYGAFNDMRAIVVANKREPIIRVIEAGGGVVINIEPPFEDVVHATHCLIEPRSISNKYSAYYPLAKQGIYCVNTLYISDYLHQICKDITDSVLPQFEKYYNRKD